MRKEVKKIMQKLIDNGVTVFDDDSYALILIEEAKKILDVDKQKELAKELNSLAEMKENEGSLCDVILRLIKYFVVSPV